MLKVMRWLLTLVMVAVVGAIIAAQFITLNQFKDIAAQKVRAATGRNLEIAGDIKLSFYPVLGAKIERLSLSNVLGAQQPFMVSVEKVMVGVKLMPLLHQQVELEKIILNKPIIYLEKNLDGQGNWEFPKNAGAPAISSTGKPSSMPVRLDGIEVIEGTLSYVDAKGGKPVKLTKLNAVANVTDMDSFARLSANGEVNGTPMKILLETDSPSAMLSEKGSPTRAEAMIYGIAGKMEGKVALTPTHLNISDLILAVQQLVAKGKVDVALGGAVPVVNTTLDLGVVNLEPLMELTTVAANFPGKAETASDVAAAPKGNYVDPALFKAAEGSLALSAEIIQTKDWKIVQPKLRANMAGGIVAAAAAGQFSSTTQSPMNLTFTTADLVALLRSEGGAFSFAAKSQDKDISAQGRLALAPGRVELSDVALKYNDQAVTGRAAITQKGGDQALDAELQLAKNGQQWTILVKTPALQKLMQPEGTTIDLTLQSGTQEAQLKGNFSNADQVIKLNPVVLILNGGTGKGYITFDQKAPLPLLTVNLDFAMLDLNPLLSFAQQPSASGTAEPIATAAPASRETPLRNLNAQINLKAKQLKAKQLQITNVDLTAALKDGILNITLPDAGLYQGKTSFKARIDGNAPEPQFNISTEGNDVNIGSLLKEAMQSDVFAGIGHWKADVTGSGTKTPTVYNTLNGQGEFELQQGVIRGMDLLQLMSAARADLGAESLIRTTSETNQLHAKGSFTVTKGVIANEDLVLQSPNLEASGKGGISLPLWQIDYRFEPKIGDRRKAGEGEKFVGQSIAVMVRGPLDHPKITPDTKDLINKGVDMLKGIKGVNKFLAPLGLGTPDVPANENTPAAGATGEETQAPKKKNKTLNMLRNLF